MFSDCNQLSFLNLTSFNTQSAETLEKMFYNCNSLTSLELGNFSNNNVTNMNSMFSGCNSLVSLDLINFNTKSVKNMENMFSDCNQLTFLNLSSFNTQSAVNLINMFHNCNSLSYLELGDFNNVNVNNMNFIFSGCNSLTTLNLKNFNIPSKANYKDMFKDCNPNLKYCLNYKNEEEMLNKLNNQLSPSNNNCTYVCVENSNSKFIIEENECIQNCFNDEIYKFEYNSICYTSCPKRTHNSSNQLYLCEKDILTCNIKCGNCSFESNDFNLCITCNTKENYFPIINDPSNFNGFINCYNETEGYYLEIMEKIYKNCFSNCKNCEEFIGEDRNKCNNCHSNQVVNYNFCFEICDYNYGKCFIKDKKYFPLSNSDINIYSFIINSEINELKDKYKSLTFIDLSPETIEFIIEQFNLDVEKDKLIGMIADYPSDNNQKVTNDYDFRIFLENGTELNLSNINEDFYIDIYTPIKDLDLARFNYSKIFAEQGYDIYDINSEFYNDICTSANLGENDITLKDRKKDIYPDNITLCKENCYYNGVNIEEQIIICKCNLNTNKNYSDSNGDENNEEDDGNFITYLLDNINYQIFKCYKLLSAFENLNHNYAFYVIAGVFIVIILIDLIFLIYTLPKIKYSMLKKAPNPLKIKEEIKNELGKQKKLSETSLLYPTKRCLKNKPKRKSKKGEKEDKRYSKYNINTKSIVVKKRGTFFKTGVDLTHTKIEKRQNFKFKERKLTLDKKRKSNKIFKNKNIKKEKEFPSDDELNNLPYTKAIILDKRNLFQIFKSILLNKLEIISILIGDEKIKIILFGEYILSLLINFFFNTLLYTDDVVSNKYHNNGKLDFIVTVTLSLLSNIITSIICYYIKYSKGIEERFDRIMEIKDEMHFIRNIMQYFRFLKIKFTCFLFSEIMIISACYYYIVIFCIVYKFSRISLLINYIMSLVEGLITSVAITIIIFVSREIGLKFLNKIFYNLSKYVNDRF